MKECLLCLQINKDNIDCIKVDSKKWHEYDIKNMIEKHLWTMEPILPTSWLCFSCWRALNDFHIFYMRIEEAHIEFGKIMKTETEPALNNQKEKLTNEEKVSLIESYLEADVLLDQYLIDHKTTIKVEDNNDLGEDAISLLKLSKRKCLSKSISRDPLKSSKYSKTKSKDRRNENSVQSNSVIGNLFETSKIEEIQINADIPQIPDDFTNSPNSSDSNNFDSYANYDYKSKKNTKLSKKTTKKKTLKYSECNDSITDLDHKREEHDSKPIKLTAKERDTFLAENFKMACIHCKIPMTNFNALTKHFEKEHNECGYAVCCDKKFKRRTTLLEHIKRHVEPYDFKCNECDKVLSSQKSLQIHQFVHLPEEKKKFECTECGNSYVEQKKLSSHISRVHLRNYERICDICGKRLRCGEAFQRHILEHEGKSLPSVSCDICGLLVSSKHNLRRHINMQHPVDGKKEYVCNICLKVSPNIYALRKHINCTHRKDNIHKCTVCERGFKRPIALREHMATHTGIALYTCPWCPKTFNASGGMHAHRKTQHPVEWEESRRQKNLEKGKTLAVTENNVNNTDLEVDVKKC